MAAADDFPYQEYQTMMQEVYGPVFLQKLASDYGIVPNTPEEARSLLEMATLLRQTVVNQLEKSANARSEFIVQAADVLRQTLNQQGLVKSAANSPAAESAQKLTEALLSNPTINQAMRKYASYLKKLQ
jgi:MinD-like ATPase involved in chromosome partitioning or flagellar assembly